MKAHFQTTPKPVNEQLPDGAFRANEDAVAVRNQANGLSAVVCDGAGGSGLFSGEWAQLLSTKLPTEPLRSYDALSDWIGDIWQPFYEECRAKAGNDTLRANKFYAEGSCATLAAVWLTADGRNMHWATYGDSCIFVFSKDYGQCLLKEPIKQFADFQHFPMLVNWHEAYMRAEAFCTGTLELPQKSEIWLASDALSMHIWRLAHALDGDAATPQKPTGKHLGVWEAHGALTDIEARKQLNSLKSSANVKFFAWEMGQLEKKGCMLNDDCSLIVIETA